MVEQHIACAAYELPLCLQYDEKYFGSGLDCAITALKLKGYLSNDRLGVSSSRVWNYIGPEVCFCLHGFLLWYMEMRINS